MRKSGILLTLVVMSLAAPAASSAHDVDVTSIARVFLDQIGPSRYLLSVVDRKVPPISSLQDVLPDGCAPLPAEAAGTRIVAGQTGSGLQTSASGRVAPSHRDEPEARSR